jgi:hypothetical protein
MNNKRKKKVGSAIPEIPIERPEARERAKILNSSGIL